MHIHILGVCGTFMAGIARLVKQTGHLVTGSDLNVYPPMSTQLESEGIQIFNGFNQDDVKNLKIDCVIVGNVIRRGNPLMEFVLDKNIPYISGPQWLAENVLKNRWVLAVAGTHGKTTTTSMLAWILESAGLKPGFLIGGVPENFGVSARLGEDPFFVIEADEYDSAFFDKRSKFIHYHPKTLILNNLEFDHADIFPDLEMIKQQCHYLIRTVPGNGQIIYHANDKNLQDVLNRGSWTPLRTFGLENGEWQAELIKEDGSEFSVIYNEKIQGKVEWNLIGKHNVENALAAISAAFHAGVTSNIAINALNSFLNVKRRLEIKGKYDGITFYDDFAHHPTAIATTLNGLRAKIGKERIVLILELGSYTMRTGVHKNTLGDALKEADFIFCKKPIDDWGLENILKNVPKPSSLHSDIDILTQAILKELRPDDHVIIMSNSGFNRIYEKLKPSTLNTNGIV